MAGNPKKSEWFSTPKDRRGHYPITLTLSPVALLKLEKLAGAQGKSRSKVVEALIRAAKL